MYAWYILVVKWIIVVTHAFAVIKHKVLGVGFLASLAGKFLPSLAHRLQHGITKRQVENWRAKCYNAVFSQI